MGTQLIFRSTTIVIVLLLLSTIPSAKAQDLHLALSGGGELAGADLGDGGWALVAWKSAANRWSRLEVFADGQRRTSWDLPGMLVKDVRWTIPGERFLLYLVELDEPGGEAHGSSETRLYAIGSGSELRLVWSSVSLRERFPSVTPSPDGRYWLGTRFEATSAQVALGRIGEPAPQWTWDLDQKRLGQPSRRSAEDYSYAFFVQDAGDPPDIGILWGARLWLARPGSEQLTRLDPPKGCDEVTFATSTAAGTWIQCNRSFDAEFIASWALYRDGFGPSVAAREPALVEQFRAPLFLEDGTVLDRYRHDGSAEVYRPVTGGAGLEHLGTIPLPPDARVLIGGGALLVEDIEGTEDYRVVALSETIGELRETP